MKTKFLKVRLVEMPGIQSYSWDTCGRKWTLAILRDSSVDYGVDRFNRPFLDHPLLEFRREFLATRIKQARTGQA